MFNTVFGRPLSLSLKSCFSATSCLLVLVFLSLISVLVLVLISACFCRRMRGTQNVKLNAPVYSEFDFVCNVKLVHDQVGLGLVQKAFISCSLSFSIVFKRKSFAKYFFLYFTKEFVQNDLYQKFHERIPQIFDPGSF